MVDQVTHIRDCPELTRPDAGPFLHGWAAHGLEAIETLIRIRQIAAVRVSFESCTGRPALLITLACGKEFLMIGRLVDLG